MSITIIALPALLVNVIGPVITPVAASVIAGIGAGTIKKTVDVLNNRKIDTNEDNCTCNIIKDLMQKELKTTIVNKDTLIKTLQEHGAYIMESENDYVLCSIEDFTLKFEKNSTIETDPYYLTIEYRNGENKLDSLIENISSEYIQNVQEASYNKIKERIGENNFTIEEEEIYDDDTIVITVNLE